METGETTTRSLSVWAALCILRPHARGGLFELEDCYGHPLWMNFKVTCEFLYDSNEWVIALSGDYPSENGEIQSHQLKLRLTARALENTSQTRLESYLFGHIQEMEADIGRERKRRVKRIIPDTYGQW